MRKILVWDEDVTKGGSESACIISFAEDGTVDNTRDLSGDELIKELESDRWDNPFASWVGKNLRRSTHEQKAK